MPTYSSSQPSFWPWQLTHNFATIIHIQRLHAVWYGFEQRYMPNWTKLHVLDTHTHTRMHARTHTCAHMHAHTQTHTHMHVFTNIQHRYVRTHIHTDMAQSKCQYPMEPGIVGWPQGKSLRPGWRTSPGRVPSSYPGMLVINHHHWQYLKILPALYVCVHCMYTCHTPNVTKLPEVSPNNCVSD